MAKTKPGDKEDQPKLMRPGLTIESRENQIISLAVDEAERQIRNGTASSQVLTHFLKLGTTIAALEREKLKNENAVLQAKAEAIKAAENRDDIYERALNAFRGYSGQDVREEEDPYDY